MEILKSKKYTIIFNNQKGLILWNHPQKFCVFKTHHDFPNIISVVPLRIKAKIIETKDDFEEFEDINHEILPKMSPSKDGAFPLGRPTYEYYNYGLYKYLHFHLYEMPDWFIDKFNLINDTDKKFINELSFPKKNCIKFNWNKDYVNKIEYRNCENQYRNFLSSKKDGDLDVYEDGYFYTGNSIYISNGNDFDFWDYGYAKMDSGIIPHYLSQLLCNVINPEKFKKWVLTYKPICILLNCGYCHGAMPLIELCFEENKYHDMQISNNIIKQFNIYGFSLDYSSEKKDDPKLLCLHDFIEK